MHATATGAGTTICAASEVIRTQWRVVDAIAQLHLHSYRTNGRSILGRSRSVSGRRCRAGALPVQRASPMNCEPCSCAGPVFRIAVAGPCPVVSYDSTRASTPQQHACLPRKPGSATCFMPTLSSFHAAEPRARSLRPSHPRRLQGRAKPAYSSKTRRSRRSSERDASPFRR